MKNDKDPITVYWSPYFVDPKNNWNILYPSPEQLYKRLNLLRDTNTDTAENMLSCPAVSARFKNTFCFSVINKTDASIVLNEQNEKVTMLNHDKSFKTSIIRGPSITDNIMIKIAYQLLFFTEEESLIMHINPPFFSSNANHLQYGSITPGSFDIGQWFRPVSAEINLWEGINDFILGPNEDLLYSEFITDRPIKLKRFEINESLIKYADSCSQSPRTIKRWIPLKERYEFFKKSELKKLILKQIKNNLLDEEK